MCVKAEVLMYHKERDLTSDMKYLKYLHLSVSVERDCETRNWSFKASWNIQLSPSRLVYLDLFRFSVQAKTYSNKVSAL